jgi:hypothetical protein
MSRADTKTIIATAEGAAENAAPINKNCSSEAHPDGFKNFG